MICGGPSVFLSFCDFVDRGHRAVPAGRSSIFIENMGSTPVGPGSGTSKNKRSSKYSVENIMELLRGTRGLDKVPSSQRYGFSSHHLQM